MQANSLLDFIKLIGWLEQLRPKTFFFFLLIVEKNWMTVVVL